MKKSKVVKVWVARDNVKAYNCFEDFYYEKPCYKVTGDNNSGYWWYSKIKAKRNKLCIKKGKCKCYELRGLQNK